VCATPETVSTTLSVTSTGPWTQALGASSEVSGSTSSIETVVDVTVSVLPLRSLAA